MDFLAVVALFLAVEVVFLAVLVLFLPVEAVFFAVVAVFLAPAVLEAVDLDVDVAFFFAVVEALDVVAFFFAVVEACFSFSTAGTKSPFT